MTEPRRLRGFTLLEVIVFIVVVGAGLAGILSVMNTTVKSSADPMVVKQKLAIAESLLEEILLKEFVKPSGSTVQGYAAGGSRVLFDCVDDYNGYTTTTGVVDGQGTAVPSLSQYNVRTQAGTAGVVVAQVTVNGSVLRQVTVTVTGPGGDITLTGHRGNY